ncbi:MAG: amidohydrolase family protein, partial [Woeseiaceae bacterium]
MTPNRFFIATLAAAVLVATTAARGETALYNITGYTSSDAGMVDFSVLVFDDAGRIVASGDEALLAAHPDARRVDGGGNTVLPGLIDAHAHVAGLGFLKTSLDLTGVRSVDDAAARIAAYAKEKPHARWITGRGWNQVLWPVRAFPNAARIDAVVGDRPVWLRRIDGHAGWANSAAMRIA